MVKNKSNNDTKLFGVCSNLIDFHDTHMPPFARFMLKIAHYTVYKKILCAQAFILQIFINLSRK